MTPQMEERASSILTTTIEPANSGACFVLDVTCWWVHWSLRCERRQRIT
jgi:hypothetical protein